ncbi:hypothetical protein QTP86_011648 [Hemibagrus guttatus]|nr:hypothetical protein QTP86_011648 [Hemibagrus guttatus]
MERRKVDILCVQETRWKGSKARSIGAGFKLFYYGVDSKRNGVGVVLKEEFVRNVLEVKRVSDRVMSLKLEIEGVMLNVVSGYAPQVGCELEEKERFWSELDEVMESIPTGERVVIGADFNGHVGEGNTGDEEVMGKFGVKERNLEGQMVVDFAKRMEMAVVNTYFQKRKEHRVTYKSGAEVIRETGRKVLGVSSGRRKEDKETWWWNEEVQDSIQRKRLAKKKWDMDRTEENRQEIKELQRRVKREVSKAKQKAYDELYTRLDTREGQKDLYRAAAVKGLHNVKKNNPNRIFLYLSLHSDVAANNPDNVKQNPENSNKAAAKDNIPEINKAAAKDNIPEINKAAAKDNIPEINKAAAKDNIPEIKESEIIASLLGNYTSKWKKQENNIKTFRCNLPPLNNGHERDTGTKTNLVTANPSILVEKYHALNEHRRSFVEEIQIFGDALLFLPAFSFPRNTAVSLRALYTMEDFNSHGPRPVFFNPEYLSNLAEFWHGQGIHSLRLSTGIMMASLALELCSNVHLYGFWPFGIHPYSKQQLSNHYYDDRPVNKRMHAMPAEFEALLNLHNKGIIHLHLQECKY